MRTNTNILQFPWKSKNLFAPASLWWEAHESFAKEFLDRAVKTARGLKIQLFPSVASFEISAFLQFLGASTIMRRPRFADREKFLYILQERLIAAFAPPVLINFHLDEVLDARFNSYLGTGARSLDLEPADPGELMMNWTEQLVAFILSAPRGTRVYADRVWVVPSPARVRELSLGFIPLQHELSGEFLRTLETLADNLGRPIVEQEKILRKAVRRVLIEKQATARRWWESGRGDSLLRFTV